MCMRPHIPKPKGERRNYSKDPAPLHWQTKDAAGYALPKPEWLDMPIGENNWLRALLYKFGASRRFTRSV